MNYYSHHIGDYLSATAHLSLLEHGIYRRLIDVYYIHEAPLPADPKQVCRLIGARTKDERDAVDSILSEFFEESLEGWKQARCDREIAITNKNRTNGNRGGRPPKNSNPTGTQPITQLEPKNNPTVTQPESPHHPSPITRHPEESTPLASHEKIVFDGRQFLNINGELSVWREAYPAINVEAELRKAAAWLVANPKNKKSQYGRFLNSWLSRAQDSAPRVSQPNIFEGVE